LTSAERAKRISASRCLNLVNCRGRNQADKAARGEVSRQAGRLKQRHIGGRPMSLLTSAQRPSGDVRRTRRDLCGGRVLVLTSGRPNRGETIHPAVSMGAYEEVLPTRVEAFPQPPVERELYRLPALVRPANVGRRSRHYSAKREQHVDDEEIRRDEPEQAAQRRLATCSADETSRAHRCERIRATA